MNLLKQINREIQDFQNKQIQIVPGLSYNQYDTINQIIFYYNSKYVTGETDADGDRKYFFNINRNPCKVYSKAIDFDTKNIRLLTTESGDSLKTWFLERDLKYWMRDKQFGKILNRIFTEIPIYGSVVLKIVDGKPEFVDLRNFIVDQQANKLSEANFIIETHNYTTGQFRKIGKKMGWKNIDEVIQAFNNQKKPQSHIRVLERYGELADEKGEYSYRRVFWADVGDDEVDNYGRLLVEKPGFELSNEEWKMENVEKLYWEFHSFKIPGRWLGVGVVEELFEPQIALNQNTNLQNKTAFWSALRVFQTRDTGINRNLMTDVQNGEILNVESEISQIDMSDRNLPYFSQQDQKWLRNRDELTFSYDVVQGERLPAGTPLGSAQLATSQTLSYFEQIQESIALDVKEMLYEVIIPQFEKDNNEEHTLRLIGKDFDNYIGMVKNQMVLQEIVKQVSEGKALPDNEGLKVIELAIEQSIKQEKEKVLKIPKNFYKGLKYDIDIDITGESVDTRVKQATVFALLQAITTDPTMTTDPIKKKFLYVLAENGGINAHEFLSAETVEPAVPGLTPLASGAQRGGGGVSAANLGAMVPGQTTQTM